MSHKFRFARFAFGAFVGEQIGRRVRKRRRRKGRKFKRQQTSVLGIRLTLNAPLCIL